jgi:hypothetical protein
MDGPLKTALDSLESQGVIMHELITYRYRSGVLAKTIVTRKYNESGDYTDSTVVVPLTGGSSV